MVEPQQIDANVLKLILVTFGVLNNILKVY